MMLRVRNLTKVFGGVYAVDNCTFNVRENLITGLIGPNGAGKTTVFNLITGFYRPTSGTVHFKNTQIDMLPTYKIAQMGIGRTFQLLKIFKSLTVMENLLVAMRMHDGEKIMPALIGTRKSKIDEDENAERCRKLLDIVGLLENCTVQAGNLGYGEQKLLEIARVLALDPELILLDEPMAGLEYETKQKLIGFIRKLKEDGKTIFIIEHDMSTIMDICDTIVVLDHGTEIACGTPAQIQKDQKVIDAYLGPAINFSKDKKEKIYNDIVNNNSIQKQKNGKEVNEEVGSC